ncbi:MAG: BON domain-containing protein [Limisphaerales bacterium]
MKTDVELKSDVLAELEYEPGVKVEDIGVSVKDGIVTLNGTVSSYAEKLAAACAVKRVAGVRGLAEDLAVEVSESARRTDSEIAATALQAIGRVSAVPEGSVKVMVREGSLTLEGMVDGWHQKTAVEEAVRHLAGVRGVTDLIKLRPGPDSVDVKRAIEAAFQRHALLDARRLQVEAEGGKVVLRGDVRSFMEREEAERAAWAAPGVTAVENRIAITI